MRDRVERGQAMVEMVLALPLFVALMGGMAWFGRVQVAESRLIMSAHYGAWLLKHGHPSHEVTVRLMQEHPSLVRRGLTVHPSVNPARAIYHATTQSVSLEWFQRTPWGQGLWIRAKCSVSGEPSGRGLSGYW